MWLALIVFFNAVTGLLMWLFFRFLDWRDNRRYHR
jgi:hypothetical protein